MEKGMSARGMGKEEMTSVVTKVKEKKWEKREKTGKIVLAFFHPFSLFPFPSQYSTVHHHVPHSRFPFRYFPWALS
jgi:hypothetical protein